MGRAFLFHVHGRPAHAVRNDWPKIAALNATLVLTTIIALIVEPNKLAVLQMLGTAVLAVACSYAGVGLAARAARRAGKQA